MTLEEIDRRFPNGFDDAEITAVTIDYRERTVTLEMSLRCNQPDSPDRDVYDKAVLTAREVYYFSIEPPDNAHLLQAKRTKITVDGLPEDPDKFEQFMHLRSHLSATAFCCRFFVHDWNSFIHIAAENADFAFGDSEAASE